MTWKGEGRTIAVVLDEEGISPHLLPLLGQVHEALAERGQRPGEAHGCEELEQVGPEDLGAEPWSVCSTAGGQAAGANTAGNSPQAPQGLEKVGGGGPESTLPLQLPHRRVQQSLGHKVRRTVLIRCPGGWEVSCSGEPRRRMRGRPAHSRRSSCPQWC